jgi:lysophospholipid hydrolase
MQIRNELAACPLFEGLPEEVLALLAESSRVVRLSGHHTLFRQGEPGDALFLVARGQLAAVLEARDLPGRQILGKAGPGSYVGEMALLTDKPRTATVLAIRDSTLIRVPASAFLKAVATYPDCALHVARTVIERSQADRARSRPDRFRTLAMIPGGPATARRMARFDHSLLSAMKAIGPTVLVDREAIHHRFPEYGDEGEKRPKEGEVAQYLDRLEEDHRFVLYSSGGDTGLWQKRCVRNADRILVLVGARDEEADPAEVSAMLAEHRKYTLAPAELVIWHAGHSIQPGVAGRWLETGLFKRHYHVRRSLADTRRLARLLVGRAYGIAFSGGGTRAIAFGGVLQAFDEAGIEIDVFAGTSGGSIAGALAAMEVPWQEMQRRIRGFARMRKWPDLGPPFVSITSGRLLNRICRAFYEDLAIEDTPRPFLASCVSLGSGRLVVPERGELWRAVRASTSLPGIFPPVPFGDDLLVDGGLVNNLPVDLIRDRCETVVGGDVSRTLDLPVPPEDAYEVSGWGLLRSRLNPFGRADARVPRIAATVVRAGMAGGKEHRERMLQVADFIVAPRVEGLGLFETDEETLAQLFQRGYEAGRDALVRAQRQEEEEGS